MHSSAPVIKVINLRFKVWIRLSIYIVYQEEKSDYMHAGFLLFLICFAAILSVEPQNSCSKVNCMIPGVILWEGSSQ